jgi:hypothetical protein
MFKVPNQFRVKDHLNLTLEEYGNNGYFLIPYSKRVKDIGLWCVASDGADWEHVSVTVRGVKRCPTWEEMNHIKKWFWGDDDIVVQFHPAKSDYISSHPYCLHLWRKFGTNDYCHVPPTILIGFKHVEVGSLK